VPSGMDELSSWRRRLPTGRHVFPTAVDRDGRAGAVAYGPQALAAALASMPAQRSARAPLRPAPPLSPGPTITLALVGGRRMLREAAASLLSAQNGLEVQGTFESVAHYLAAEWENQPQVVLLDCDEEAPAEFRSAVEALRAAGCPRIAMLCREASEEAVRCAIEHGVSGILLKSYSAEDMRAALAYTATGRTVLPAGWQRAVEPQVRARPGLSPRHREILALIARGRGNEEIARELNLSQNTIKFHVRALYSRMGVRNRVEAANRYAQMTSGEA
jgi:DNA-binding NarL/FixJ family response regulator